MKPRRLPLIAVSVTHRFDHAKLPAIAHAIGRANPSRGELQSFLRGAISKAVAEAERAYERRREDEDEKRESPDERG